MSQGRRGNKGEDKARNNVDNGEKKRSFRKNI